MATGATWIEAALNGPWGRERQPGIPVAVEEIALRILAELKPDYPIKTNVEYYAAAVLQGVGLPPNLFPATFALARHAGWTAHALEQAEANVLIRPDVRYVGPGERHLER